jgi:hypothetical protein
LLGGLLIYVMTIYCGAGIVDIERVYLKQMGRSGVAGGD